MHGPAEVRHERLDNLERDIALITLEPEAGPRIGVDASPSVAALLEVGDLVNFGEPQSYRIAAISRRTYLVRGRTIWLDET